MEETKRKEDTSPGIKNEKKLKPGLWIEPANNQLSTEGF